MEFEFSLGNCPRSLKQRLEPKNSVRSPHFCALLQVQSLHLTRHIGFPALAE